MAKDFKNKGRFQKRKLRKEGALPFDRTNYLLLALGVVVIIAGFIAMSEGSVEGTLPLVVAPILLVTGYCIIIPLGILYRKKQAPPAAPSQREGPKGPAA